MTICNNICETGEWPTPWTQSLVITLPKKGNLQQCQNYRTISLFSRPSKVMLKIKLNRLKPQADKDHCSRTGRLQSRKEHHRAYFQPENPLWEISPASARPLPCLQRLQEGLRQDLACSFVGNHEEEQRQHLPYPSHQTLLCKATSAVLFNGSIWDWFWTKVGAPLRCLLSPTLFNTYLERIMIIKRQKLKWLRHVSRSSVLAKTILQGTVKGGRRHGRQKQRWKDNIKEWAGLEFKRAVKKWEKWRKLVVKSSVVPQRPAIKGEGESKEMAEHRLETKQLPSKIIQLNLVSAIPSSWQRLSEEAVWAVSHHWVTKWLG